MSSILNALKKLEQETGEKTTGFLPENVEKPKGKRKKTVVFAIGGWCLLALAGAGTIVFYSGQQGAEHVADRETTVLKNKPPAPEMPASFATTAEKSASQADPAPQKFVAVGDGGDHRASSGQRTAGFRPAELQKHAPPLSDGGRGNLSAPSISPTAPPIAAPTKKSDGPAAPGQEAPVPDHPSAVNPLQDAAVSVDSESVSPHLPEPAPPAVQEKAGATTVKREMISRMAVLADPAIELQAISWSVDPEKRLAIINGKICREKEHVAGYVIEAIYAEEVVLSKGSVSGKLVFNVR